MKKLLCLLLVFLLLCPALAAADGDAYHPGDTFEAVFTVTDNPQGAEIIMAQLEYDPFVFQPLPSQGLYQNTGVIFSGSSVAVSFQISPYAPSGTYEIGMTVLDAANEKSSGLPVTIQSVRVTVAEGKPAAPEITAAPKITAAPEKPAAPEKDFHYIIEYDKATITKYTGKGGDVVIPATLGGKPVGRIGEKSFYENKKLTSVTIPDSVTKIGDHAFSKCSGLTSVTIPDSVTSIGLDAFLSCSSLTSVTIPDSVTIIEQSAFAFCSSLTSVTLPDSVTSIGSYAFKYCKSLTSVTIPDSVMSIGVGSFSSCSSLTNIDVRNRHYISWKGILFNKDKSTLIAYPGGLAGDYVIPDSVTSIEAWAFSGCSNLTSVTIPNSVTSIGSWAFEDCSSLTSVTIPNSVTSIGKYAFSGCSSDLVITVAKNSYAETYCKSHNLKYKTK